MAGNTELSDYGHRTSWSSRPFGGEQKSKDFLQSLCRQLLADGPWPARPAIAVGTNVVEMLPMMGTAKTPMATTSGIVVAMATAMPMMPTVATPVKATVLVIAVMVVMVASKPVVSVHAATGDGASGDQSPESAESFAVAAGRFRAALLRREADGRPFAVLERRPARLAGALLS